MIATCNCGKTFEVIAGKKYCSLKCRSRAERQRRREKDAKDSEPVGDERIFATLDAPTPAAFALILSARATAAPEKAIEVTNAGELLLSAFPDLVEFEPKKWIYV